QALESVFGIRLWIGRVPQVDPNEPGNRLHQAYLRDVREWDVRLNVLVFPKFLQTVFADNKFPAVEKTPDPYDQRVKDAHGDCHPARFLPARRKNPDPDTDNDKTKQDVDKFFLPRLGEGFAVHALEVGMGSGHDHFLSASGLLSRSRLGSAQQSETSGPRQYDTRRDL